MRITQRSDGYSIDPQAVRPGSSDALFARTIDATQRAPLVKAQEAITTAVPRIIDAVPPPLLGGTIGLTVLTFMVASQRVRFRMAPVLTAGVLLLPVSNYHAAQSPAQPQVAVETVADKTESFDRFDWRSQSPRAIEPAQLPEEPEYPAEPEHPDEPQLEDFHTPSNDFLIPPEIKDGVVPLVDMVVPDEWTDERQLRILRRRAEKLMEEIRKLRLEQELEERLERSTRRFQRL